MNVNEIINYVENHGFIDDEVKDACIEALRKIEKHKWHDLRKNTDDLPKEGDELYLYVDRFDDDPKTARGWWINRYHDTEEIIAWIEIEPFEEVDNEK